MNEKLEKGFQETTRGAGCSPTERIVEAAKTGRELRGVADKAAQEVEELRDHLEEAGLSALVDKANRAGELLSEIFYAVPLTDEQVKA